MPEDCESTPAAVLAPPIAHEALEVRGLVHDVPYRRTEPRGFEAIVLAHESVHSSVAQPALNPLHEVQDRVLREPIVDVAPMQAKARWGTRCHRVEV
jgi:hypothetical protein